MKGSKTGGAITRLASNQYRPDKLVVDATSVYWTNFDGGTVMKVSISGNPEPTLLASALGTEPYGIAVDSQFVYWTSSSGGTINAVPLNGGAVTIISSSLSSPMNIAVDATNLYWTVAGDSSNPTGMLMGMAKP
jgi:hypothetical protein